MSSPAQLYAFDGTSWGNLQDARIPLASAQYLYGAGTFATFRCIRGAPTWWPQHIARLSAAAELLHINLPDACMLHQLARDGAKLFPGQDCTIRLNLCAMAPEAALATFGSTALLTAVARPYAELPHARIAWTAQRQIADQAISRAHKLAHYLPNMLAKHTHPDADEVLLEGSDGGVSSGSVSNLFGIHNGSLVTPHLASDCRPGIARAAVLAYLRTNHLRVVERKLEASELLELDAAFVTNAGWGVRAVASCSVGQSTREFAPHAITAQVKAWIEADLLASIAQR